MRLSPPVGNDFFRVCFNILFTNGISLFFSRVQDPEIFYAVTCQLREGRNGFRTGSSLSNDQLIVTEIEGIYLFENVQPGDYLLEFDFGDNQLLDSRPFKVNSAFPSVIIEPVPYSTGFQFSLRRPVKVHRTITATEVSRSVDIPPNDDPPASPYRPDK